MMRLVLRNWHSYYRRSTRYILYPVPEYEKEYLSPEDMEIREELRAQERRERKEDIANGEILRFQKKLKKTKLEKLGFDVEWPTAAPHLMLEGYKYLEPINRAQLAREKLSSYEKSLNLSIQNTFEERLHCENHVRKRQAELFINRMGPLTPTFLKQGANFLSAHVFAKLMESGRIEILKDLLRGGAFESATFVTRQFLLDYIPIFVNNPRNEFLLNVLCFEASFINPEDPKIKKRSQLETKIASESVADEMVFGKALSKIQKNHKELNRLRLFWSFQRLYLNQEDHLDHIFEELNHVSFRVEPALQAEVTREVKLILNSAYSSVSFEGLLMELVAKFSTFHEFVTAYALSVLALSKLRAIKRLLPESKCNELHPVFQMIEFNLSKEAHQELILSLLSMLSHEDHSRIEYENFKRSYNYWLKDYTQPLRTLYHSPLSRLLEGNESPLEVFYERSPSQPAYAKFTHKLTRSKEAASPRKYFGQADMVRHILKKDYQPVLDHFLTTFHLATHKEYSKKFMERMKEVDRTLVFSDNNEAALYKLKAAHEIFFSQSLPNPLSPQNMEPHKQSYNAIVSITDDLIARDEYTKQYRSFSRFQNFTRMLQQMGNIIQNSARQLKIRAEKKSGQWKPPVRRGGKAAVKKAAVKKAAVEGEAVEGEAVEAAAEAVELSAEEKEALVEAEAVATRASKKSKALRLQAAEDKWHQLCEIREALIDFVYFQSDFAQTTSEEDSQDSEETKILKQKMRDQLEVQIEDSENAYELYLFDREELIYEPELEEGEEPSTVDLEDLHTEQVQFRRRVQQAIQESQQEMKRGFFTKKRGDGEEESEESGTTEEGESSESSELQNRPIYRRPRPSEERRTSYFTKKNRFEYCTATEVPEVAAPASVPASVPGFELERIEEYRRKEVDQGFLSLLQSEQHVSTLASGNIVAKYLFLHGKNESGFVARPKRTLNIEFTSVIGTRAKNYERFVRGSLFRYALPEELYEELLLGQAKRYNRHEFKMIVAHLAYYCDSLNDHVVKALCSICERERIGYTFVEIAQLIKANEIRLTPEGLQTITDLWQRFDVINEDMLPFLREYTRKMQMPLRTGFYASFCRSLIRTKDFEKLEVIALAILQEIRPRPFKLDASTGGLRGEQVAQLEKEWKAREQENYLRLYIELVEVIVRSLDTTVPAYLADLLDEYRRLRPDFNEKELGYAFVSYALKRDKVEELLLRLDNEPEKGTSFMYDCLVQTLLSNFDALEDLSEKMLDATILKNRIVLTQPQIMRSLTVFKKSSSSNSFSKFLDHCLRFQEDISQSFEIKREMFYILNNNVEDVSVGGIFNLLDFIFNEKRQKERVEYRAVKLSEEEKARKLVEIQQSVTKAAPKPKEPEKAPAKKEGKKKGKQAEKAPEGEEKPEEKEKEGEREREGEKEKEGEKQEEAKGLTKKQEKKKLKKQMTSEREYQKQILDQVMAEQEARSLPQTAEMRGNTDEEFVGMIKSQTRRHESTKRKSLQSMSSLFEGSIELTKEEEVPKGKGKDEKKGDPKDAKDDKKKKGKK